MAKYATRLDIDDYIVLQDDCDYGFSQDSVILANVAEIKQNDVVLDVGCGTGILATLALVKKHARKAVGLEVQPRLCDLAWEGACINGLQDRLEIVNGDVKDVKNLVGAGQFDKVLCNPPYFSQGASDGVKSVSRTESSATLFDFVKAAAWALRFGGDLYIAYKADKLCSLLSTLCENTLMPKEITLVYPKLSKGADVAIVKARKGAKEGLKIKALVVKNEDGTDTNEFKELYR